MRTLRSARARHADYLLADLLQADQAAARVRLAANGVTAWRADAGDGAEPSVGGTATDDDAMTTEQTLRTK